MLVGPGQWTDRRPTLPVPVDEPTDLHVWIREAPGAILRPRTPVRWIVSTLLLLALSAGFAWLVRDRAVAPSPIPAPSTPAAAVAPAPAAAAPDTVPLRELAAAAGVLVRVVDAATRAPLPGAEVFWYGKNVGSPPQTEAEHRQRAADPEAFAIQRGLRVVADQRGCARLAAAGWFALVARAGDRYGEAFSERLVDEITVSLRAEQALLVRTVDAARRPVAGIPVRFRGTWLDRGRSVEWSALLPPSDEKGLARLPNVQELVSPRSAVRLAPMSLSADAVWQAATVAASATRLDGEPVAVDLRNLPADPVDVVVAAAGTIELVLKGADGAPFPLPPGPQLSAVLIPDGGMAKPIEPTLDTRPWGPDGRAVFAAVATGRRYELLGRTNWYDGVAFAGPSRPGGRVVVDVPVVPGQAWLAGRLVGEDGSPWTRGASLRMGGNHLLPGHPEGRFFVPVPDHAGRQPKAWFSAAESRLEAGLTFPAPLPDGLTDVGAVVMRPPPLLVSGQVVVRGAADPAAFRAKLQARIESWNPEASFGRPDWLPVQLDEEGRFVVHSSPRNVDYVFVVDGNTLPGAFAKFTPGTVGLVVPASPGNTLEVSYRVDPQWGTLTVSLVRVGAPPGQFRNSMATSCNAGRVVADFDSLESGPYQIVAALGAVVLDRRTVVVGEGQVPNDPNLVDIDLRRSARTILVTVTDAQGRAIAGTQVGSRPAGAGDDRWSVQSYRPGEGGMPLVVEGPLDVCVWAPGHRAAQQSTAEGAAFVLQRLPRVTVRWADAPELPAACVVRLQWERAANGPAPAPVFGPGARGAELVREALLGGELPFLLPEGGASLSAEPDQRLSVRFVLDREGRRSAPFAVLPAELDPATFVDGQVIELRAAAAVVQAALEQVARK